MSANLNYENYIKRESEKVNPQFLQIKKENKTTSEHYILSVKSYYRDYIPFKFSIEHTIAELGLEILRINKIFNTKDPKYDIVHNENKLRELKLFKRRQFKSNHIFKIGEWNFYEKDYLLNP